MLKKLVKLYSKMSIASRDSASKRNQEPLDLQPVISLHLQVFEQRHSLFSLGPVHSPPEVAFADAKEKQRNAADTNETIAAVILVLVVITQ